jgi:hypothetical protein
MVTRKCGSLVARAGRSTGVTKQVGPGCGNVNKVERFWTRLFEGLAPDPHRQNKSLRMSILMRLTSDDGMALQMLIGRYPSTGVSALTAGD